MTAQTLGSPTTDPPVDLDSARAHVAAVALSPGDERRVGLELELHVVDLAVPGRRPAWSTVAALVRDAPPLPAGSALSLEPGGQVELSTQPAPDLATAVEALRTDLAVLRAALRSRGLGGAGLGADPARPALRTNPHPRYAAMEAHFDTVGCGPAGREMMTATAALQVNLDAGRAPDWAGRLSLLHALVPVLVAASAGSPWLAGRRSGWHSMRQEAWYRIDHARTGPVPEATVTHGWPDRWADYALAAPVMLVRDGDGLTPARRRFSFAEWTARPALVGRPPTSSDLDYHLSTLFPPVRPRGYLEIRCLDSLPDRWWPAMAALAVTLVDDPVAADRAAELCEPVAARLEHAARDGIADPVVRAATLGCVEVAAARCPVPLRDGVERLAALLGAGRTPGDELHTRADAHGPLRLLEEEANA
ncbi:ergothioneine biosynthesis glutamate--cysteine ligase EgtA [Nocardioides sp. GCM10027113]|uniref:ergothioneine biosynthesis glutamate--cysteine ligase EgtA n=1 Tax=unclassified Nocardioides TaxID=2615069 RepID=UPI00360FE923